MSGASAPVADETARLQDEELAGRDVPGAQVHLPEAVHPPGRDVGEVERRRAGAAHVARALEKGPKRGQVAPRFGQVLEREAGGE